MGSSLSTRWGGHKGRRRVESCFAICPPRTRRNPDVFKGGRWLWPRYGFSVEYLVRGGSVLALFFGTAGGAHTQDVALDSTAPHYGGRRLWFLCPGCGVRTGRLYLPPGRDRFLCRGCHSLAYESAQASRAFYYEMFRSTARERGGTSRWVRELVRESRGGRLVAHMVGQLDVGRAVGIGEGLQPMLS
jgi:hypothetical protein